MSRYWPWAVPDSVEAGTAPNLVQNVYCTERQARLKYSAGRLSHCRSGLPFARDNVPRCGIEVLPNFWKISGKILPRRMDTQVKHFYVFGPFRFDPEERVLMRDGNPVPLGPKVVETLLLLVLNAGHLVDKDDLMKGVWPDAFVEEGNLNKHIFVLRKTLGQWDGGLEYIETVPKRGYRFVAPVNRVSAAETLQGLSPPFGSYLTGKKVSHYRVLELLGGGGMGMVYRAEDLKLGRRVALKFLPEDLVSDSIAVERFEREARAASALNHPNICTIYAIEEYDKQPFIAMELLEGETVRENISSSPTVSSGSTICLQLDKLLDVAIQVAEGLDAAHRRGIIHRDIKPANIFVTIHGQAKILDFGLAKLQQSDTPEQQASLVHQQPKREWNPILTLTRTGMAIGTAGYMSPEQVRGEKLDTRTDLFSFGMVLYEMATGQRAFRGDTAPILRDAILTSTPIRACSLNPELPLALEEIIDKALEKKRESRYQNASDIRADLKRLKSDIELARTASERQPRVTQFGLDAGSKKALWWILPVFSAIIAGLFLGLHQWQGSRPTASWQTMQFTKLTDSGRAENVAISPEGRYVVYSLREGEKLSLWVRQVATGVDAQLLPPDNVSLDGFSFSPDGNYVYFLRSGQKLLSFRYLYVMPVLGGPARKLITDIDSPVSFSPDGRQFVFTRGVPSRNCVEVRIANADGSGDHLLVVVREASHAYQPGATWSPDGRTIAVPVCLSGKVSRCVLDTISVPNGITKELKSNGTAAIGRALWLSGGNTLLAPFEDPSSHRMQIWEISYPQAQVRRLTNDLADYSMWLDSTRDTKTLATVQIRGVFNVWETKTLDSSGGKQVTTGELEMIDVAVAPNGYLFVRSRDGQLWRMNRDGSGRIRLSDKSVLEPPVFCGGSIFLNTLRDNTAELMRLDGDGSHPAILFSGEVWSPTCTLDGQKLYFGITGQHPEKIMSLPVNGGTPEEVADAVGDGVVGRLRISPDGRFLAYPYQEFGSNDGLKLAVIPSGGGPPVKRFQVPTEVGQTNALGETMIRLRWSPEGNSLQFPLTENGVTNIWDQPLAGEHVKKITDFKSGQILDFDWAQDHRLLVTRGNFTSDVVLISNFR
jgi:eukaryotic-like serine/threonine-protein kinase